MWGMLCSVMKMTFRNYSMPSEAITIYVQDRLNALSRVHPIRSANLLITRGPPDSLSYQVRAELHLGDLALVSDAGSHSFRGAFERVLQNLKVLLLRPPSKSRSLPKSRNIVA